jgi:hypothetical protein
MPGKKCEMNSSKLLSYEKNPQKSTSKKKKKQTTKWIPRNSLTTTRKQRKISTNQTCNN